MKKLFGEYYVISIVTLWFVALSMIAKDALESVFGIIAICFAVVLAIVIVKTTTDKPVHIKAMALVGSVVFICLLVGLFVKREVSPESRQRIETK